jgi:hypothetical protein
MTKINDGGSAFPLIKKLDNQFNKPWVAETVGGMSLRDWFAGQALAHMIGGDAPQLTTWARVAAACYDAADAMLKAREAQS